MTSDLILQSCRIEGKLFEFCSNSHQHSLSKNVNKLTRGKKMMQEKSAAASYKEQ